MKKIALYALEAAAHGFDLLWVANMYRLVYAREGFSGIDRIVQNFRQQDIRSWLRKARRAKHIEEKRVGDRVQITLTDSGWSSLLKLRIQGADNLPKEEMILVAFDFPISQGKARDVFRYFLKSCGFKKIQQSLYFSRKDVEASLMDFMKRSGSQSWIRIFHTTKPKKT